MPKHPAYKTIFQPKYSTKFADKPSAIPTFGIRIYKLLQDIPIIELSEIAEDQFGPLTSQLFGSTLELV